MDSTGTINTALQRDTICAISTPYGTGGIAVVRVSGPHTFAIIQKCWKGASIETMASHTAHLGSIIDSDGSTLDEVVLTIYRAPRSFTTDDVAEISCHGSVWIQQQLVQRLIDAGCRLAQPGEFTQRAFAAGRIDLSQAEAIADVIAASSKQAHKIAMSQMKGAFKQQLATLRQQLIDFVSLIELELDFSEEDVEFADRSNLVQLATHIHDVISHLANSFHAGNAIKNGIPVAIVGETNAGKSTLLNGLVGDERALVSDIHGTTRDLIEDTITLQGTLFRFIDTAGIRQTTDTVEKMGINRTLQTINKAQIILWVIDGTSSKAQIEEVAQQIKQQLLTNDENDYSCSHAPVFALVNKDDLLTDIQRQEISLTIASAMPQAKQIFISALRHRGIEELTQAIVQQAISATQTETDVIVTNARHYEALVHAREAISRTLDGLQQGISGDFLSQDIRECMHYLAEITGEITTTDILSTIFTRFCVGK